MNLIPHAIGRPGGVRTGIKALRGLAGCCPKDSFRVLKALLPFPAFSKVLLHEVQLKQSLPLLNSQVCEVEWPEELSGARDQASAAPGLRERSER
jgi:hypothetical protein